MEICVWVNRVNEERETSIWKVSHFENGGIEEEYLIEKRMSH